MIFISLFGFRSVKLTDLRVEIVSGATDFTAATPSGSFPLILILVVFAQVTGSDSGVRRITQTAPGY